MHDLVNLSDLTDSNDLHDLTVKEYLIGTIFTCFDL